MFSPFLFIDAVPLLKVTGNNPFYIWREGRYRQKIEISQAITSVQDGKRWGDPQMQMAYTMMSLSSQASRSVRETWTVMRWR
jgi:hypothetical protein